jgi:uncharacterized protein YecT (DUF1311 family)
MTLPFTNYVAVALRGALLVVSFLSLGWFAPALAANSAVKDPCAGSASEGTLLACRQTQLDLSNANLKSALHRLDARNRAEAPELARAVSAAQAAWLTYQAAECRVRTYDSRGGKAFRAYWMACLHDLNVARLLELRRLQDEP